MVLVGAEFRQRQPDAGKWTTLIRSFNPASGDLNARTVGDGSPGPIAGQHPSDHLNHRLTPPFCLQSARNAGTLSMANSFLSVVYPGMVYWSNYVAHKNSAAQAT